MQQSSLFHGEHVPARVQYQELFKYLPVIEHEYRFGRPGVDPNIMLRAFIYGCLRRLPTLSDLNYSLRENPSLCEGLDGPSNPDLTPPAVFATLRSMNALIQTGRYQRAGAHVAGKTISYHFITSSCAYRPFKMVLTGGSSR